MTSNEKALIDAIKFLLSDLNSDIDYESRLIALQAIEQASKPAN